MKNYIELEDAIQAVAEFIDSDYPAHELAVEDAEFALQDVPSADVVARTEYEELIKTKVDEVVEHLKEQIPERKTGEWIDLEIPLEDGGSMPAQACNRCKTFYPLAYTGGGHNFCPNCGARMKGADDE